MTVRYPEYKQKELLNRVKALLSEGHSMNSACSAVSLRERGLPTTNTLAKWAKAAQMSSTTASPPSERLRSPIGSAAENTPTVEATDDPAPAFDESCHRVSEPAAEPAIASAASADNGDDANPAVGVDEHPAELVHVSAAGFENAVEENQFLRRAADEANREIRAMRDLLVVYAARWPPGRPRGPDQGPRRVRSS